jgi:glycerate dehydrogenase
MTNTPNLVVADGLTTTQTDLSWDALGRLGALKVYERCGPLLVERCRHADVILTNKEVLDRATLDQLPALRFVSVLATGTNVVDLAHAHERGVVVSNVPDYSTASVAQHAFALLLALNNRVHEHDRAAQDGRWTDSGHFSFPVGTIAELDGKQLGVVGYGSIGRHMARIARAFGMRVVAARSSQGSAAPSSAAPSKDDVPRVSLDELFAQSDVVSLHCPLTEDTRHLVNRERLRSMKPDALLLNTARGALVDEHALREALERGFLGGAGLDVLSREPPASDHPLLGAPRCLITPHVAWASRQARQRLLEISIENVRAFLQGRPQNVVTGANG